MADKKDDTEFLIRLKGVRLSFPKIWRAEAYRGGKRGSQEGTGEKSFQATFLLDKKNPDHKKYYEEIEDTIDDALAAKFGKDIPKLKPDKFPLHNGDDEEHEGYENTWFLRSRSKTRPEIRDADGKTILVEEDGRPYAGCYVNAWVKIWVQDNEYGKRVNCSLEAIQFVRDGEAFSGNKKLDDDEFKDERSEDDRSARGSRRSRDSDDGDRGRGRDRDEGRSERRSRRDEEDAPRRSRDDEDEAPRRRRAI